MQPTSAQQEMIFTLIIDSQEMLVQFRPRRFADYGHFEFRSPYDPPRRILLSHTGYMSHFAPMHEIGEAQSVEEYARVLALTLSQHRAMPDHDEDGSEEGATDQLSFF